jgi:hypothetical protein
MSVMGKSQLLVWGAAINTLLWACAGSCPSTRQPAHFKQVSESHLKHGLTPGVVKMVRCMGWHYCRALGGLWQLSNTPRWFFNPQVVNDGGFISLMNSLK